MNIGEWKATSDFNEIYLNLRRLGLEGNVAELEAFGFTVIERAASEELVEQLKNAICAEVEAKTGNRPDESRDPDALAGMHYRNHLLGKDPAFEQALLLEKPLALVKYLLGDSCIFSTMGSHFRGAGGDELSLHADIGGWLPVPYPHQAMFANYTLALTDYTRETGALAVVPGSHRKCRGPEGAETQVTGNEYAIPVEAPAGSAIVWHGNLWHGGYVRETSGYRINLAMLFLRPGLIPQEDYRGLLPQDMFERNGAAFARLMGRDVPWMFTEKDGLDYRKAGLQALANARGHGNIGGTGLE